MLPSPGSLWPPQQGCPQQGAIPVTATDRASGVSQGWDILGDLSCHANTSKPAKQLHLPSPRPHNVLTGTLWIRCVPLPALTPSQGTSATSARGLRGGKRIHKPHPTPQPHCQPPDCPTIVIPRLQISDLTLYPFWFSSGLILSGCEETQGQLRTRDGLSAMPTPRAHQPQRGLSRVRAT